MLLWRLVCFWASGASLEQLQVWDGVGGTGLVHRSLFCFFNLSTVFEVLCPSWWRTLPLTLPSAGLDGSHEDSAAAQCEVSSQQPHFCNSKDCFLLFLNPEEGSSHTFMETNLKSFELWRCVEWIHRRFLKMECEFSEEDGTSSVVFHTCASSVLVVIDPSVSRVPRRPHSVTQPQAGRYRGFRKPNTLWSSYPLKPTRFRDMIITTSSSFHFSHMTRRGPSPGIKLFFSVSVFFQLQPVTLSPLSLPLSAPLSFITASVCSRSVDLPHRLKPPHIPAAPSRASPLVLQLLFLLGAFQKPVNTSTHPE